MGQYAELETDAVESCLKRKASKPGLISKWCSKRPSLLTRSLRPFTRFDQSTMVCETEVDTSMFLCLDSTYLIGPDAVDRTEYKQYCQDNNGTYLSVMSKKHFDKITAALMKWSNGSKQVQDLFKNGRNVYFWTSARYVDEEALNEHGERTYLKWAINQPTKLNFTYLNLIVKIRRQSNNKSSMILMQLSPSTSLYFPICQIVPLN